MTTEKLCKFFGLAVFLMLFMVISAVGAGEDEVITDKGIDLQALEEAGIDPAGILDPSIAGNTVPKEIPTLNSIPQDSVLLIANSTLPDGVDMFDPFDGEYLGRLITDTLHLSTPQCAIKGPDGNIYVSDQIEDGVQVYDTSGAWLYTYCDRYDSLNGLGLDNVRGIDFRNDTLFVTCGGTRDLVAMFDAPHNRLADFINGGMDPYDIHFLDDGRALISDMAGDNIKLYNADGTFAQVVISTDFPEQTTYDDLAPGDFLTTAFSDQDIKDFDLDGTIPQITPLTNYGRGIYRLGNGNLLAAYYNGVIEVEPGTGNVIEVESSGGGFHMIELFVRDTGPAPTGRCCYNSSQDCVDTTQAACTGLGGVWSAGLNCTDDPCPVNPNGRCCYNNNADCVDTVEAACLALGGDWSAGLNCTDDPCPTGGGCDYVPGDVNGSNSYNGLDITYGVAYFKGGADPLCNVCSLCPDWYYCGDVNGSCSYNGLDITYGVAYFKGGPLPMFCQDCPPIR